MDWLNRILKRLPTLIGASITEAWENHTIDPSFWVATNPGVGPAWDVQSMSEGVIAARGMPDALDSCRLRSIDNWVRNPIQEGDAGNIVKKTVLEFELFISALTNILNTTTFWGLTNAVGSKRNTDDIIGFCLTADALTTITDSGGVETTNTGFGETLNMNWNKLRIELALGKVEFYLNETLIATHITNLPTQAMYLNFYLETEAGGAPPGAQNLLGIIRCWSEG